MDISIATPKGYEPDKKVVKNSKKFIHIELTNDPQKSVKNADVVMTDTFKSIHNNDPKRMKKFLPKFQVNPSLMKKAKNNAIFIHCLPSKRGS